MTRTNPLPALLAALALVACGTAAMLLSAPPKAATHAGGRLFVVDAGSATLTRHGGTATLALHGVDPKLVWFDDRPERHAGAQTVSFFVHAWGPSGFAADPPNAVLERDADPGVTDHGAAGTAVVLSHPHLVAGDTVTFTVRADHGASLAALPTTLGPVSLFVDDASGGPVYQPITFQVSNATPGDTVEIRLEGQGGNPVAFSLAPPGIAATGVVVESPLGQVVPLQDVAVTAQTITVQTSSDSPGGGSLDYSVQAWLEGTSASTQVFTLQAQAEDGATVSASLDNRQAVTLGAAAPVAVSWSPA